MNRNRLRLIDALRTLDTLSPEPNFRWNFGVTYNQKVCSSVGCALGVAFILDKSNEILLNSIKGALFRTDPDRFKSSMMFLADYFDLSEPDIYSTFYDKTIYNTASWNDVQPAMVADRLDSLP